MYFEAPKNENGIVLKNVSKHHLTETGKKNWLSYWKHFNRKDYCQCAKEGCTEEHHHGVLVKQAGSASKKMYVVPVCKTHSSCDIETLTIDSKVDIISAELSL